MLFTCFVNYVFMLQCCFHGVVLITCTVPCHSHAGATAGTRTTHAPTKLHYFHIPYLFCSIAVGDLPPPGSVQGLRILGDAAPYATSMVSTRIDSVTIGAGLPPIPAKLVSRIEAGKYINMTELLPDKLGILRTAASDDSFKTTRPRRKALSGILEWIQSFAIYMAVVCRKQPHRIQDLLGYQTLIVEASLEYQGDSWVGYDRRFRQRAATNPSLLWANTDPTLWNLAFSGQARVSRCRHCFILSHTTEHCDWAPDPTPLMMSHPTSSQYPQHQQLPICRAWNNDPRPLCPVPQCSYRHICWQCYSDDHKACHCPQSGRPSAASGRGQKPQSQVKAIPLFRR